MRDDHEGKPWIKVQKTRVGFQAYLVGHIATLSVAQNKQEAVGECVLKATRLLGLHVTVEYPGNPDREPVPPVPVAAHAAVAIGDQP